MGFATPLLETSTCCVSLQIRFQRMPAFFVLFCAFVVQLHCLQRKNRGMCENEFETYIIMWKKLRYLCI